MNNRIDQKFKELKDQRKKAFVAFITAGDPNLKMTEELVVSFESSGVDMVELGVPFSDPMADGPTIQAASERALKNNVNLDSIFDTVEKIRKRSQMPIALMTYYNPVFHYTEDRFVKRAKEAGVDGVVIPDLPPEEAEHLIALAKKSDLSVVFFISPTTTQRRTKKIVEASTGFIYYVSLTGVTGIRQELPQYFLNGIMTAKRFTDKPICVGFGLSTPAQVRNMAKVADGVIVGSAIVKEIEKNLKDSNLVKNVNDFIKTLTEVLKA